MTADMTIRIPEADLLKLLGQNGEHWLRGSWERADKMCLHGAIRRCSPQRGDAFLIEQVANRQGWGTNWNDCKGTEWVQVRERLAHVEATDVDLADTFGPQWEQIVALVRRAAVLTADEMLDLAVARAAAGDAAWAAAWAAAGAAAGAAAWGVAWGVAWDVARAAAGAAAWAAAGAAAGAAAWGVAGALMIRHVIGQHGFTQEHYDLLTGPWRKVIGPVHPDDKEADRG
jgi:hypothetical protein